jgi:SPP1 gp7 family putative phage head morphogenesis protein
MLQRTTIRLAFDKGRAKRKPFARARKVEERYARQLRKVARTIGDIINGFDLVEPEAMARLQATMANYARVLEPWATSVATRMLAEVSQRDEAAWVTMSKDLSRGLRNELATAPTGQAMRVLLADQVNLITSLPTEAAERVHKLTMEALLTGTRASETAKEIMRSGEVTRSRATLIARTETARTASLLTQVRAEHVGITHFWWRTSEDGDVRPSHKKMADRVCEFANPPIVDGKPLVAGQTYNCRCWAEPIIED